MLSKSKKFLCNSLLVNRVDSLSPLSIPDLKDCSHSFLLDSSLSSRNMQLQNLYLLQESTRAYSSM